MRTNTEKRTDASRFLSPPPGSYAALKIAEAELEEAREELGEAREEIAGLYSSRSWRITGPLRALFAFIRGLRARIRGEKGRPAEAVQAVQPALPTDAGSPPGPLPPTGPPVEPETPGGLFADPVEAEPRLPLEKAPVARFEEQRDVCEGEPDVRLIAYHLPQFHCFPENDAWWGKGFTEWTNVRRARPFFAGHVQPLRPHSSVGYYELGPEVLRKQAALARQHGIYGFCFHHYWFSGKRLMETPVDSLLAAPDLEIPFCLNWANENWTRRWDGLDQEILIAQKYSPEDDKAFMRDLLRYFADPRYIRIEGRPLLLVYLPGLLPEPASTVLRWREVCAEAGEREPFLVMVQSFLPIRDPRPERFDAIAQFPPHGAQIAVTVDGAHEDFEGRFLSYSRLMQSLSECWTDEYLTFPGVAPAWDNTPRRMNKATVVAGTSPAAYQYWLEQSCDFVRRAYPPELRYVFVNSWNEWAEGAQLEPSESAGYGWLNATARGLRK